MNNMCKCLKCKRSASEIKPSVRNKYAKKVPILYIADGCAPVCIRCATEDIIPLSLYGRPLVEYIVETDSFEYTDSAFNNIKYTLDIEDLKHNSNIIQNVLYKLPKPERSVLNL